MAYPTPFEQAVLALRTAGCVFAEAEAELVWARFSSTGERRAAIEQRSTGKPLEYVVGRAEFAGIHVEIGPPAFVPRHRAEALVDEADRYTATHVVRPGHRLVAVDLGCGCGAIAAALASRHAEWDVHATDIDADALTYARVNGKRIGFAVHEGDWFAGLPAQLGGVCDLVVAHLPYVPTGELGSLPRDFGDHEARVAVDGGVDGLDPWRTVTKMAGGWLAPRGVVLTQVAQHQVEHALHIAAASALEAKVIRPEGDEHVAVVSAAATGTSAEAMGQTLRS
ncbi:MAG: methyltransferase [Propionibacteriales bacterium]|nr:methyltransferase [Propionibacteriales bacterium]